MKHGVRPKSARVLRRQVRYMIEGTLARAAIAPAAWRTRTGLLRDRIRPFGTEHRVHVATLSAVRGDLRPALRICRAVDGVAQRSLATFRGTRRRHRGLRLAWHSVQCGCRFYRKCFDAFRDQRFPGDSLDRIARFVGKPRSGAREFHRAQHRSRNWKCWNAPRAFVTHGGMNSVSESLYNGVPVLVIPHLGEQALVGRRAEELGAGALSREGGGHAGGAPRAGSAPALRTTTFRRQAAAIGGVLQEQREAWRAPPRPSAAIPGSRRRPARKISRAASDGSE